MNLRNVPVIGKDISRGVNKLAGAGGHRGQAQFQITDTGRKRFHSMEGLSGPEMQVLKALAMRTCAMSGWDILNALEGQMDTPTLKVVLRELQEKHCVQRIEGA